MWTYDPYSFICNRRQKNKLSPYIHHRIPKIEQYANQTEWVEGTLIYRDSTEVIVDNVLMELYRSYAHYLRMAPKNQTRLTSAFDIKEGKMQMSFLKPTTQQPKSMADYLKKDFEVMEKDIHPIDQIELHKQTRKMVYSTLISKATASHQLQNSLNNISAQF